MKGEVEERLPYTLHIDMDNAVWLQERVDTLNAECTCGRKHTFEGQINDMLKYSRQVVGIAVTNSAIELPLGTGKIRK